MSAKPYKNSKGVNKPFCSPFNTPQNNINKSNINTPESSERKTPLKISVAKRLLFQQTPPCKRLCVNKGDDNEIGTKLKSELYRSDLELLKMRIQQKEKSINDLKTTLLYRKKNKAEDLESVIKKWTDCCQNALWDYQKDLQERNGQIVEMSIILSSFNIEPDIVHFSIDDGTFY
ncbi:unnamed protein product [Xylocopa violacea]|uniref:Swi5-dependent recombination DNA repair protein 1 homolog n=1 Tax=Xylocopa violacea TaxID=135666 RepID=A0ABP1NE71_XYLVO